MTETNPTPARTRLRLAFLMGTLIVFLGLLGLGYYRTTVGRPVIGDQAPELSMEFYDGYTWQNRPTSMLSDLQGNVVLLNFWASWCAPCRLEAATLEAVSRDYADKGVVFLGIAWSDTEPKALEYLAEYDITYPNAPDIQLSGADTYGFDQVPETYIINRNGTIIDFHVGPVTDEQLRDMLDIALSQ